MSVRGSRALALLLVVLGVSCGGSDPAPYCARFQSSFEVQDSTGDQPGEFAPAESVRFVTRVTNLGRETESFEYGGCSDLQVTVENDEGAVLWGSEDDLVCTAEIKTATYPPGESRARTVAWDQRQRDGAQAAAGRHVAHFRVLTHCAEELNRSTPFVITP